MIFPTLRKPINFASIATLVPSSRLSLRNSKPLGYVLVSTISAEMVVEELIELANLVYIKCTKPQTGRFTYSLLLRKGRG
jgi:hypothetical protein